MRDDVYSPSDVGNTKSNPSDLSEGGLDGGAKNRKKRSRDKKGDDGDGCSSRKRKKKRKRSSE